MANENNIEQIQMIIQKKLKKCGGKLKTGTHGASKRAKQTKKRTD
jgi:hypothetical protein